MQTECNNNFRITDPSFFMNMIDKIQEDMTDPQTLKPRTPCRALDAFWHGVYAVCMLLGPDIAFDVFKDKYPDIWQSIKRDTRYNITNGRINAHPADIHEGN